MNASPDDAIITLRGVCKGLYDLNGQTLNKDILVLDDVNFSLARGEVHVLLGENGAGKSSLVKMICGAIEPDSGQVFIEDREVAHNDPHQALASGVAIVSQEFSLCPNLTVAENISLGREPLAGVVRHIDRREMRARAARQLVRLNAAYINPDTPVKRLPVAEQQLVEIAKALSVEPKVLILDEPTSALTDNQVERLFEVVRLLRKDGVSMIYITHKMKEIFEIGDRVTVLRDGKTIRTERVSEVGDVDDMIQLMIGSKLENLFQRAPVRVGEVALRVEGLRRKGCPPVSLEVRQGEIIGLAGIVGAGRTELVRCIFGVDSYEEGRIQVFGRELRKGDPKAAIAAGMGFIPEDRKRQGIVPLLSVCDNLNHIAARRNSLRGLVGRTSRRRRAAEYVRKLKVVAASLDQEIRYLSGGNQQKVVLGKWLAADARVLIMDEPTRGIDVAAKSAIYRLMNGLAGQGVAIVMISSELQEIVGMSDRVYVMRNHAVAAALAGKDINGENILRYAMGGDEVAGAV